MSGPTLFMIILICFTGAVKKPDPRCVAKDCPTNTTCRVVKTCTGSSRSHFCFLEARCLDKPPESSQTFRCTFGDPILEMRLGTLQDTTCHPGSPCIDGSYCNTELADTYATCCLSDPHKPVKPGFCPAVKAHKDHFCVDMCQNDGDCRWDYKCCNRGCDKACMQPATSGKDPCDSKKCPYQTYCLRPGQNCSWPCGKVGECVSCPPVCYIGCIYGNVKDSNGCEICECNASPTETPRNRSKNRSKNLKPGAPESQFEPKQGKIYISAVL
ncbi:antistasin/wap-like serine protease inhibitor [Plakobranchus ocellatus]|uniref:Antistasin/wap-like serine protease inhibitor n=1 Tax=Plakobranchus ocellatus TaxID=259542 RepID=A0AAV4BQB0_9GAST|nr:antistasin/wap-like serine protease inhibitor [Plakobranchus ocellatus]